MAKTAFAIQAVPEVALAMFARSGTDRLLRRRHRSQDVPVAGASMDVVVTGRVATAI